jgi:hypothetical protein
MIAAPRRRNAVVLEMLLDFVATINCSGHDRDIRFGGRGTGGPHGLTNVTARVCAGRLLSDCTCFSLSTGN